VSDLFTTSALAVLVVSFGIGIVVGLTGMGGGALMTPALIFLGINPTAAIANDLVSAAVTRSVGAAVHWRVGKPNLRLAGLLVCSSVPTAFAGAFLDKLFGDPAQQQHLLKLALGAALLLTATTFVLRVYVQLRYVGGDNTAPVGDPPVKPIPTLLVGAAGGLLVGVTSVGAGSLIMVALLLLYPTLSAVKLVGTDLVQAVPLVASAALGHILFGDFQLSITLPLLVGSIPGVYVGARLSSTLPGGLIRRALAFVLLASALKLLTFSTTHTGEILGAALLLAPLAWMGARRHYGFPALTKNREGDRKKATVG
jgi:uncharacterized protein